MHVVRGLAVASDVDAVDHAINLLAFLARADVGAVGELVSANGMWLLASRSLPAA